MSGALLGCRGVTKRFGGLTAVNKVDFDLAEGQIMGLIGPNGAGKTTLFNMISGALPLNDGVVVFQGKPISRLKSFQVCRLGIGRTFQIPKPLQNLSVLENVLVGALLRTNSMEAAREEAEKTVAFLGLDSRKNVIAKNLGIPDRKRLEVAKALATKPRLLLLDEVMAGLTPSEVDDLGLHIRKIRDSGVSILLIEHIMRAVINLTETVIVLANGEKIAEGSPQEIIHNDTVIKAYLGDDYDA